MFEDTKGVIRIRKSSKNRQHNGQKKKDKQRSTRQTHKTKDRVTRAPLKLNLLQYMLCMQIIMLLNINTFMLKINI